MSPAPARPEVGLSASMRRRGLTAVVASMAVTSLVYGVSFPLLSLVLDRHGVNASLIGLNTAVQSFSAFVVAPLAPPLLARFGPARLMVAAIATEVGLFLLLPTFPNVYAWFPLRFALGVAGSLVWVAGETWLNAVAGERSRGRVVALYTAALSGGFAIGPVLLSVTGSEGWLPFLAAAALMTVAALPAAYARDAAPSLGGRRTTPLIAYAFLAPAAMLLNLAFAAADGALMSFLPIYGLRLGIDEATALRLIAVMGFGGFALQYPVGWLIDHADRRRVLIAGVVLVIVGCLAMPVLITMSGARWLFMIAFGGALTSLYSISVVYLGERFRGNDLAAATTVFSVMWNLGALAGPPLAGVAIDLWNPHGLPMAVAAIFVLYLPVAILSRRTAPTPGNNRNKRGQTPI